MFRKNKGLHFESVSNFKIIVPDKKCFLSKKRSSFLIKLYSIYLKRIDEQVETLQYINYCENRQLLRKSGDYLHLTKD